MSAFDSKRFRALQKSWYAKLAKTGFVDIEREDGTLIDEDKAYRANRLDPDSAHAKREYYRAAEHYQTRSSFMSKQEARIWALHVEGYSAREIAETLGISRARADKAISKHRTYMLNASRLANTSEQ